MSDTKSIGDVVRRWREESKLSVTELAQKAGLSKGYVSEVENSKIAQPKIDQLEKLGKALGISVQDIISRRMPPFKSSLSLARSSPDIGSRSRNSSKPPIEERLRKLINDAGLSPAEELIFANAMEEMARTFLNRQNDFMRLYEDQRGDSDV